VALANLQENAKLQPLLPAIAKFLQNLLGFSHENIYIIQRIPLVIHALMKNPHLFLMPEVKSNSFLGFWEALYCIINISLINSFKACCLKNIK